MFSIVAGLAVLSLTSALSVNYKDCGSQTGTINSVEVSPCTQEPCFLRRGHNTTVTVKYTSKENTGNLKAVVHGIIAGLPIPFPLPNGDGCKGTGTACPITTGQSYSYTATLPVYKIYPTIKVVVKWQIQDPAGIDVFCFVLPVEITD